MNRSILIILCDFLLVTLVAFSTFEPEQAPPTELAPAPEAPITQAREDLVGTLRLVLENEQQSRDQLAANLQTTERALAERERTLAEREQTLRQLERDLRRTEAQAAAIEQERTTIAQQSLAAQSSLTEAQRKLAAAQAESLLSREVVASLEADLKKREQEAQALQQQLATAERSVQAALAEKQQLQAQLQVSETEKRLSLEQMAELRNTVTTEREEKARIQAYTTVLATNFATLAQKSGEIAQRSVELTREIRDQRVRTANEVYSQFLTNRVTAQFAAAKAGLFGREVTRDKTSQGVLFGKGPQTYLLLHVDDTPLTLWNPGTDWTRLIAILARGSSTFHAARLLFLAEDPRVVVIPVDASKATEWKVNVYATAADPARFQEAVIVGASEEYYGECQFRIEPATPRYVKLDRSFIRGLFGKFNPSRGDLVFSKSGELLGIMANREYCVVLNRLTPSRTIELGGDVRGQHTGQILSQLYDRLNQLPVNLQ